MAKKKIKGFISAFKQIKLMALNSIMWNLTKYEIKIKEKQRKKNETIEINCWQLMMMIEPKGMLLSLTISSSRPWAKQILFFG